MWGHFFVYFFLNTQRSIVNCMSMAMPITIIGATSLCMPICMQSQKRTICSPKFTACEPENPMKCFQVGCWRKVKRHVV